MTGHLTLGALGVGSPLNLGVKVALAEVGIRQWRTTMWRGDLQCVKNADTSSLRTLSRGFCLSTSLFNFNKLFRFIHIFIGTLHAKY